MESSAIASTPTSPRSSVETTDQVSGTRSSAVVAAQAICAPETSPPNHSTPPPSVPANATSAVTMIQFGDPMRLKPLPAPVSSCTGPV